MKGKKNMDYVEIPEHVHVSSISFDSKGKIHYFYLRSSIEIYKGECEINDYECPWL